jgi:UDP-glucuronate 4-epimerase
MGENKMRIIVTGGKGFVGKRLITKMMMDHDVYSYDIEDGQDIRNLHDLDKFFEYIQPQCVIHLAARTGVRRSVDHPHEYLTTNVEGTWNVGKMCEQYGCRLISFSTASVFGNDYPPIKEDDPKKPISLYGMTKEVGEHIVNNLTIPTTIVRPFNLYGEGGRGDQVFFKWINQLKTGRPVTVYNTVGSCRGYTYVGDLVDVVSRLAVMWWSWDHEHFNIGGAETVYLHDVYEIFKSCVPKFNKKVILLDAPKSDIIANYACIEKAKAMIGFDPPKNFKEKLTSIIKMELGDA